MVTSQIAVLIYFFIIVVHFIVFTTVKPKIDPSRKSMCCVKSIYLLVWTVLLVLVLGMLVRAVIYSWQASNFNQKWLDVLSTPQVEYSCTAEPLWINIELIKAKYSTSPAN